MVLTGAITAFAPQAGAATSCGGQLPDWLDAAYTGTYVVYGYGDTPMPLSIRFVGNDVTVESSSRDLDAIHTSFLGKGSVSGVLQGALQWTVGTRKPESLYPSKCDSAGKVIAAKWNGSNFGGPVSLMAGGDVTRSGSK
ncbi:hypothetical protein JMUB6875_43030 [Nocardia sp. JMUB6875]